MHQDRFIVSGQQPRAAVVRGALILIALLYVAVCFTPVIFDDNEGLYAGAVREMHQRGDWLMPVSNGFPRVQKPPLVYWTMLVSTTLLGENEFALRLPNALATAGWIVATYLIARRLGGERLGLAAALVHASMVGIWVFTHLVQPEPFLALFISLAIWPLVEARAQPDRTSRCVPVFWLAVALAVLSKGVHGLFWPLTVMLLAAVMLPGWRTTLRPFFSPRGLALFLVLVVPWYVDMSLRLPGFLWAHFINEQLGAALNTRYPADARQLSLAQFYLQHLIFWMPWTLLFPAAIALAWKYWPEPGDHFSVPARATRDSGLLLAIWVGVTLTTVAISTRQDYYSMSCWGAVAIFLAWPWAGPLMLPRRFFFVPTLIIALAGAAALIATAWVESVKASLGAATAAPIGQRDTFFDAISGISPGLWSHFLVLGAIFGAALLVGGSIASVLAWRRRNLAALGVLGGMMAVPVILATIGFTLMSGYFSLAVEARAINRQLPLHPGAIVACEARPNTASSLLYYLDARVHWVNAPFDNQYAQQVLKEGRDFYWNDETLETAWAGPRALYLIVEQDRVDYWRAHLAPPPHVLARSGTRLVLSNVKEL
jgi:4-amino-4-deoxy-L-arabinose transferase-like glycosyltransferase